MTRFKDASEARGALKHAIDQGSCLFDDSLLDWGILDVHEAITEDLHDQMRTALQLMIKDPESDEANRAWCGLVDDALDVVADRIVDL